MGIDWLKKEQEGYADDAYTDETLKNWVAKGKITAEQYKEITGKDYEE